MILLIRPYLCLSGHLAHARSFAMTIIIRIAHSFSPFAQVKTTIYRNLGSYTQTARSNVREKESTNSRYACRASHHLRDELEFMTVFSLWPVTNSDI
ncbi:uncharacterized protein V1518DRAFT_421433 [Limtongia smithiae]|uniref:uncharacterized protein n=1 Tax=Limtongia smithiae TaxID=1125753 RepID=UPI0034CDE46A